jgi:glutamate synthase (NADPH/NADH) large chain
MAQLGLRRFDKMVGQSGIIRFQGARTHWKSRGLDFSAIFAAPDTSDGRAIRCCREQTDPLTDNIDWEIINQIGDAINKKEKVAVQLPVRNVNRTVGTILSNHIVSYTVLMVCLMIPFL